MPEPVEGENGLECTPSHGLQLAKAQTELQKYLELTLIHLDGMCQLLEDCSDFWLMLHQAELQLKKLEKEAKAFCEDPIEHRRGGKVSMQSFCEHVRSFCGTYGGSLRTNVAVC